MNIRQVLRTYSLLRQLTDDESALLETLCGLSDAERESLVVALQPEKTTTKRASKKSSKSASKIPLCVACGYAEASIVHRNDSLSDFHQFQPPKKLSASKSRRAGIETVFKKHLRRQRQAARSNDDDNNPTYCHFIVNTITGETCDIPEDDPIHDLTYSSSHEFDAGKSSGSVAQPACGRSSTNGGAGSGTANSEIEKEDVSNVHHAGG